MDQSYDVNSVMQKHWGAMLSEFMWNALASCTHHSSVAIADIGASTGLNSCKSLKPHLERFRGISEAPVLLYHTDRPENHWNALFTNLTGSPDSYQSVPNVYSFAVGKSFYTQNFPSNSIDIAYACATFHWLSRPAAGRNVLYPAQIYPQELHPVMQARHREDLLTNLTARYAELKPGGHLIFDLPDCSATFRIMQTPIIEVAEEMHLAGLLPPDYLANFPMPIALSSAAVNLSIIRSMTPAFEVVDVKVVEGKFELYQEYEATGDLEGYAKKFAGFWKGFSYPYLKALCTQGEEGEATIQLFYQKIEENIKRNPEPIYNKHGCFHLCKPSTN